MSPCGIEVEVFQTLHPDLDFFQSSMHIHDIPIASTLNKKQHRQQHGYAIHENCCIGQSNQSFVY